MDANASLIGVVRVDGQLMQKHVDKDGNESFSPIEDIKTQPSITERFADTETRPADWKPETDSASALIEPVPLTREQHIRRSCQMEAILVKAFSSATMTGTLDTRGNGALREVLQDLCMSLGGDWADRAKQIK